MSTHTPSADGGPRAASAPTSCVLQPTPASDPAIQATPHAAHPDDRTRRYLSLAVMATVMLLAFVAVIQPAASEILDQMLPLCTLVLGYFFGQQRRPRWSCSS